MKIKYAGNRSIVSIMCSGRKNYVFYADNGFTQEVLDQQHAAQILRSTQHRFEVLSDMPSKPVEVPVVAKVEPPLPKPELKPFEPLKLKKGKSVKLIGGGKPMKKVGGDK